MEGWEEESLQLMSSELMSKEFVEEEVLAEGKMMRVHEMEVGVES